MNRSSTSKAATNSSTMPALISSAEMEIDAVYILLKLHFICVNF
jgi:hypothetical protein